MKNTFYIDEKVTIWRRTWYSSDDDNLQQKLIESVSGESETPEVFNSEFILETEDLMTPQENGNQSTIEIFNQDGKMIWSNEPTKTN